MRLPLSIQEQLHPLQPPGLTYLWSQCLACLRCQRLQGCSPRSHWRWLGLPQSPTVPLRLCPILLHPHLHPHLNQLLPLCLPCRCTRAVAPVVPPAAMARVAASASVAAGVLAWAMEPASTHPVPMAAARFWWAAAGRGSTPTSSTASTPTLPAPPRCMPAPASAATAAPSWSGPTTPP